ncbi:MAG TPA: SpoIID/LytB domain-containing protein [Acidimicrobiales bacterium]|nr:SpoIID/LytB domain-containing protein [Acidimicrobiales bacterium]
MGWRRRGAAALVGMVAWGLVAPRASVAQTAQPPTDAWIVDRPTFEPIDPTPQPLAVPGVGEYRGSIEIARSPNAASKLAVVNHVAIDDYVRGISEVPSAWPLEAQKAQAVAARTYALYEATRQQVATTATATKLAGADLCATDACQVYAGVAKERRAGSEAWNAAVAQTRNQVLLYKNAPIAAKYSSSNGGETVAGGQPYLRGAIPDPDDAYSPLHRWRATYPIAAVARVAGLAAEPVGLRRDDQRIVATYVDLDGNPVEEEVSVEAFRDAVNNGFSSPAGLPLPVPSRRFDIHVEAGLAVLEGRGWGHGIGLSQYGALGKAVRGMKFTDILAAYYAGLKPTTVPQEQLPQTLKVAVAFDRAAVELMTTAAGRFRIVDGSGRVLAHAATGTWTATPAPDGRIKLTPPPGQAGRPTAAIAAVRPDLPVAGNPLAVTVALDGPGALTKIDLVRPDGTTQAVDPQKLRSSGPVQLRIGNAVLAGTYEVTVERDAGNGRVETVKLPIEVPATSGEGAASTASPSGGDDDDGGGDLESDLAFSGVAHVAGVPIPSRALQATATFMLLAVIVLGGFWVGRRPGIELH